MWVTISVLKACALKRNHFRLLTLLLMCMTASCASMISSVTSGLADDLANTVLNSEDVDTVREGIPAYLLMIDSFLRNSPDSPDLLLAASNINGAFSVFTTGMRSELLTTKSLDYALRAACISKRSLCDIRKESFKDFKLVVDELDARDTETAFAVAMAWASWIQAHSADWNAVADLAKVKYLMEKIILLDESYGDGSPHLYMGGLETVIPASMGGRPEKGKAHFERAIEISDGKFLMAKVYYAERYAKLAFDKELHDKLLKEVLAAEPVVEGLTLMNTVAQQRARELLAESDDYF